jgi:tetratricopeptide (TPR) repeat protein
MCDGLLTRSGQQGIIEKREIMNRDNFSLRVRQVLAERVAYVCSNPTCQRPTIGPHSSPNKPLKIGRAAHIKAAAPGGPRYDKQQTAEERSSISNGIWLCADCADIIDKDADNYPVTLLLSWKNSSEKTALERLQKGIRPSNDVKVCINAELQASRALNKAFDLLAGQSFSTRITWRGITPKTLEKARRFISEAATLDPNAKMLRLVRALFLIASGYPERALYEMEGIETENDKLKLGVDLARARCLYEMGRESEYLEILGRLSKESDAPPAVFYNLGFAKLEAGDGESAQSLFQKAIQEDSNYAEAYDQLAGISFKKGERQAACSFAARAYALNPMDEMITVHYALILLELERTEEALEILEPAIRTFPGSSDVLNYLGRAYGAIGDFRRGERCLRRALDLEPSDPIALQNLGVVLALTGRFDEATKTFEDAHDSQHPFPEQIKKNLEIITSLRKKFPDNG